MRIFALSFTAALMLTGCAPASENPDETPEPTEVVTETPTDPSGPPSVNTLVLSLAGLGPVQIDRAAVYEGDSAILRQQPQCIGVNSAGEDVEYFLVESIWDATFPGVYPGQLVRPFAVGIDQNNMLVNRIDVYTSEIKTDKGIKVGSSISEILSAYSGQIVFDEDWDITRVTVVSDGNTQITFETAIAADDYWTDAALIGKVVMFRLETSEAGYYATWGTENGAGFCPSQSAGEV
ncbi:MAG: hypothetical protein KF916_05020 [Microbacteriaceae bacterium]|nr:hypothetical protein [Microbacteriaceae bacterium]